MALATYNSGTVSIGAGATVIAGNGSVWSGTNARAGDTIAVAGREVTIVDVVDETHLTIDAWPYAAVAAGAAYKIYQVSPLRFAGAAAMADVSTLVAALNKDGFFFFVGPNEMAPDPSLGADGQYARQPTTSKEWLKIGGVWVYQGVTGSFNLDSTPWSAGTTYAQRTIVSRAGKLWLSLQGNNIGHPPENGAPWWSLFMSGGDAYDIPLFDTDRPSDGELVWKMVLTKTVQFYAGMTDSRARADVAATNASLYVLYKNGVQFATLNFPAGSSIGAFDAVATTFLPGDILTVFAPQTRDPTLSGIAATLSGYRS